MKREELMRTYLLSIAAATLFAIFTPAFSDDIHVRPGRVKIAPNYGHHR
jgi:hypothetical protein